MHIMKKYMGLAILLIFALSACSVITPTPIYITATPQPTAPLTDTLEPPTQSAPTAVPATATRPPLPTPTLLGAPAAEDFRYHIVAYYPSWGVYARKYSPVDIPVQMLTHINYAFGKIDVHKLECIYADTTVDDNNFIDLRMMKKNYPHLKVLLSIGGWTLSNGFSDAALSEASRQHFVKSCIDLYMGWYPEVFDGFDIDWEYPVGGGLETNTYRPEDKHNLTLLMQEFRRQLDERGQEQGREFLLTAAVPAGPLNYVNFELKELAEVVDWMNLMAFDFHGAWDQTTNFNAPLFTAKDDPSGQSIDAAVQAYLAAGVPSRKLNLGIPFYGRGWKGVPPENNGLYQSVDGLPVGTFTYGYYDYWDIVTRFMYKKDYLRYWSEEAQAAWLYSVKDGVFITFDDPQTVGLKADYIVKNNLGGAMVWDLSNDDGSLLSTLFYRMYTRPVLGRP
jgi:chitinase